MNSLDIELFECLHTGVRLKDADRAYYNTIKDTLRQLGNQTQAFKLNHGQSSLTMMTLHAIAGTWLMPRLVQYRELHSHTRLEIKTVENIDPAASNQTVIVCSLTGPNQSGTSVFIEMGIITVFSTSWLNWVNAALQANKRSENDILIDAN